MSAVAFDLVYNLIKINPPDKSKAGGMTDDQYIQVMLYNTSQSATCFIKTLETASEFLYGALFMSLLIRCDTFPEFTRTYL